jgi:salicylate hydroxylase
VSVATPVAIVGAGIGGLTAALCLHRQGIEVEVFEQAPVLGEIGAGLQISPNASKLLRRLGLGDELDSVGVRPEAFVMRRWRDESLIFESPLGASVEAQYGAPYYTFHRADLHGVLAGAVPSELVRTGRKLAEVHPDGTGVRLVFTEGPEVTASVVIGADGLRSVVRQSVLSDDAVYSQMAEFRGLAPADRAQETVDLNVTTMWVGPGRHMVCYPVRSAKLLNWGLAFPGEAGPESWTAGGTTADALAALDGWNERTRSIVAATDDPLVLPLYDRNPIQRLSHDRMTLLGDAAHPMLPFMAQGAGQAIEDGWVLADCLADSIRSVAERLHVYEELRAARAEQVQRMSRGNAEMFHLPDGDAQRRRDAALAGGAMSPDAFDWLYGYDAADALATADGVRDA